MKKEMKMILVALVALLIIAQAAAAAMIIPANDNADQARAAEKSPVIGDGWQLERVDFIHYAKPPAPPRPPKSDSCYGLLGYKWKTLPVNYVINPVNPQGLSQDFVTSAISGSAETWDSATAAELYSDSYGIDNGAIYGVQDYVNAIDFGDFADPNVIGVTTTWYFPRGKQLVEFDMRFNTSYPWGDAEVDPSKMDLRNIATHELGHSVGLDDIYTASCSAVTMYGYSSVGDLAKISLEQPDITGLQAMYGP